MAQLNEVLLQGTRAAQPLATAVADGTLYYVTDEFLIEQSDASAWSAYSGTSGALGINQLTGDITAGPGVGSQAATIANLAVTTGKLADNAVTDAKFRQGAALSLVGVTGNAVANVADIVAASDHQVLRRSGAALAFGQVNLAQANAITGILPVANGGTGLASSVPLQLATVTLTDAQIKALPTTPIQLVAAPGAGLRLVPMYVTLQLDAVAGAYTNISAVYSDVHLKQAGGGYWSYVAANDNSMTTPLTGMDSFLGTAHECVIDVAGMARDVALFSAATGSFQYVVPLQVGSFAVWENVAFQLFADNSGGGDFTGGNAANSLIVRTYYTTEPI